MGGSALKNAKVAKDGNEAKANMDGKYSDGIMFKPSIFAVSSAFLRLDNYRSGEELSIGLC